jgi:hypothetical protein
LHHTHISNKPNASPGIFPIILSNQNKSLESPCLAGGFIVWLCQQESAIRRRPRPTAGDEEREGVRELRVAMPPRRRHVDVKGLRVSVDEADV